MLTSVPDVAKLDPRRTSVPTFMLWHENDIDSSRKKWRYGGTGR